MRLTWVAIMLVAIGCDTLDDFAPPDGVVTCLDDEPIDIKSDPTACGGCPGIGEICAEGVACIDYFCDYTSVVHCGARGRACLGEGAACIPVPEACDDDPLRCPPMPPTPAGGSPPHGEVIQGYACTNLVSDPDRPPVIDGGVEPGVEPRPAFTPPKWVRVPGLSEGCHRGDARRCHHAFVELTDICGRACAPVPFDYDYRVMATEMSRAQYRDAVCDCSYIETRQCADVCDPAQAADDALPITGLNWCMAQAACEAVGARLPTAAERARLEQLASAERALFTGANCQEWQRRAGNQPRVGECIDLDGTPELVAVDDPRGAMGAGAGVSPRPPTLYHPLGNASEWLLDGAAQIRCGMADGVEEAPPVPDGWARMSAIQGRSAMSPRGEPVTQVAVSPDTRAVDLGVRCVQADGGPTLDTLPGLPGACDPDAPLGHTAARRTTVDSLYRAVEACPVSRQPSAVGWDKLDRFVEPLIDEVTPLVWSQDREARLGQVWFTPDAQWWIGQPAEVGATLSFEFLRRSPAWMMWEAHDLTSETPCASRMRAQYPDHDGSIVRRLDFIIEREQLAQVFTDEEPVLLACAHLECIDPASADPCETSCMAWRLPVVVGFEWVEPFDHPELCEP